MKITEIKWENGKQYRDNIGCLWVVNSGETELINEREELLSELKLTRYISEMDFKEVIDWSKVPVDTKVLVSGNGKDWLNRYFAKFEDGEVFAWSGGGTSWSTKDPRCCGYWKYAKLAEECDK